MRSYEDGKWAIEMDANLNKDRAWAVGLPDNEWTWLLPPEYRRSREWRKGVPDSVNVAALSWPYNVQAARYHFQFEEYCRALKQWKPELMILEVPEHARAVRMCQEHLGMNFPIVGYVNYLEGFSYTTKPAPVSSWWRFVDGLSECDAVAFNTPGLIESFEGKMLESGAHRSFPYFGRGGLEEKIVLWRACYSPREMAKWEPATRHKGRPILNFISRLSDEKRTRWPQLFEAAARIPELEVWVGNPNRAMTEGEIRSRLPNATRIGYSSREEYVESMRDSTIVPIFWAQDRIYSIGYCDAIASGNIPIVARERLGSDVEGVLVSDEADADEIELALRTAIDWATTPPIAERRTTEHLEWLMDRRSVERNGDDMQASMEEILCRRG